MSKSLACSLSTPNARGYRRLSANEIIIGVMATQIDVDPALAKFHPCTQTWFAEAFAGPTKAQVRAWEPITSGDSTLLLAPTGSGKTLAAFLASLDRLMFDDHGALMSRKTKRCACSTSRHSKHWASISIATCVRLSLASAPSRSAPTNRFANRRSPCVRATRRKRNAARSHGTRPTF